MATTDDADDYSPLLRAATFGRVLFVVLTLLWLGVAGGVFYFSSRAGENVATVDKESKQIAQQLSHTEKKLTGITEQVGAANTGVEKLTKEVNAADARVQALTKQLKQVDVPKQLAGFAAQLKTLEAQLGLIRTDLKALQTERVRIAESDYHLIPAKRGWDVLNAVEKRIGFLPTGQNVFVPLQQADPNVVAAWVKVVEGPKQILPSIDALSVSAHGNELLLHASIHDKAPLERMKLRIYALMR